MELIPNYDAWKLDDGMSDDKPVCQCEHCDAELYEGEDVIELDGEYFCEMECLIDFIGARKTTAEKH